MIMRTVRNQPRTTREDLVNDLKAAGTIVTKKTIDNTLRRERLKSCSARKVPLLKKAHVQARLKFANDSEENWVHFFVSGQTYKISRGSNNFPPSVFTELLYKITLALVIFGINSTHVISSHCSWHHLSHKTKTQEHFCTNILNFRA